MPKVFTIPHGLVVTIGGWGPASNDSPAIVPDDVASECDRDERLRVERDAEPVVKAKKARKGEE